MKSFFFTSVVILLITSCSPNLILVKNIELDTKTDQYVAEKFLSQEVSNYELLATLKFNDSYRENKTGWAGFFMKTNKANGLHGEDPGYLFFIRENGNIGLSSGPFNKEVSSNKYLRSLEYGKKINIKIISFDSELKIFINGKEQFNVPNLGIKGKYISINAGGTNVSIRIESLKKI